jgi:hypothetical protein
VRKPAVHSFPIFGVPYFLPVVASLLRCFEFDERYDHQAKKRDVAANP